MFGVRPSDPGFPFSCCIFTLKRDFLMSKMAQFAYVYGIVRGAGGNFSSEDSAVLHNDGDGCSSVGRSFVGNGRMRRARKRDDF